MSFDLNELMAKFVSHAQGIARGAWFSVLERYYDRREYIAAQRRIQDRIAAEYANVVPVRFGT